MKVRYVLLKLSESLASEQGCQPFLRVLTARELAYLDI
jgi:hypothetical protein